MDFRESLEYLYGLQRFGIKLGLDNTRRLLGSLGHPERTLKVLHVGGTNGKGSVSATLAEILRKGGRRVGLYTSPHLHSFTERVQIDGVPIAEEEVARLTAEIRSLAPDVPATFFEFTTAMALLYFARNAVEFAVLEVGMGGRLDATNACDPLLTFITPICHDHAEHLGGTLPQIAAEKAGIIKPRVPVVVGRQEPAALEVLERTARERGAPLYLAGRDFTARSGEQGCFDFDGKGVRLKSLVPGLLGRHQHDNLAMALAGAMLLRSGDLSLSSQTLREAVEAVRWPGRLEWWKDEGKVLLDGAHNEGGARVLAEYLRSLGGRRIRWVVALKGDKDPRGILDPLLPLCDQLYCTVPPVEQAVDPEVLRKNAETAGCPARTFGSPQEALNTALAERGDDDLVLVAGSLFLVAAAREFLMLKEGACR